VKKKLGEKNKIKVKKQTQVKKQGHGTAPTALDSERRWKS
jgi:hypothetical protein